MINYNDGKIFETVKEIPKHGEYDIVVAGGGVAGFGAAIAAAKRGYKTLLIEATSALGGLATMGLVNIPLDFISGVGKEMMSELDRLGGHWHRNTNVEIHKLVLDEMVKKYHVEVLFVTQVVDAIMDGNTLKGCVIQTKTGRKYILAKRFIDATGDSDLAFYAGAECESGREGDGMSQACSLEFCLGGVDWDKYLASDLKKTDGRWVKIIRESLADGSLTYESDNHLNWITHIPGRPQHCGQDEVSICFVHSRNCFPLDPKDLTRMYFEGREQATMLANFIKKKIPGFENSFLTTTASLLGVRESRRIVGEYRLTAEDIAFCRNSDDVIAISNHGYDIHNFEDTGNIKWAPIMLNGELQYVISNSGGFGTTTPPPDGKPVVNVKGQTAEFAEFEPNRFYDVPYGCLVPVRVENLLAAGRNLSSDVYAQSGARLILCCLAMGEAAGVASCLSLEADVTPRKVDVKTLQKELISTGCNIGQGLRKIDGIDTEDSDVDNDSGENYHRAAVVKNRANEFTRK